MGFTSPNWVGRCHIGHHGPTLLMLGGRGSRAGGCGNADGTLHILSIESNTCNVRRRQPICLGANGSCSGLERSPWLRLKC